MAEMAGGGCEGERLRATVRGIYCGAARGRLPWERVGSAGVALAKAVVRVRDKATAATRVCNEAQGRKDQGGWAADEKSEAWTDCRSGEEKRWAMAVVFRCSRFLAALSRPRYVLSVTLSGDASGGRAPEITCVGWLPLFGRCSPAAFSGCLLSLGRAHSAREPIPSASLCSLLEPLTSMCSSCIHASCALRKYQNC